MDRVIDEPMDRRDLKDELDQSRTTVYRGLDQLEAADLVAERAGTYRATLFGRLVYETLTDSAGSVRAYRNGQDLLATLDATGDVPPEVLAECELVPVQRSSPLEATGRYHDILRSADHVDLLSPVPFPKCLTLLHGRITDDGASVSAVVEKAVVSHLREEWTEQFRAARETGRLSVRVTEVVLPYGLLVTREPDRRMCLCVYDDGGSFRGIVHGDAASAVAWAERTYESQASEAEPL